MSLIKPEAGLAALEGVLGRQSISISGLPSAPAVISAVPFLWGRFLQRQQQRGLDTSMFSEFEAPAQTSADAAGVQSADSGMSAAAIKELVFSSVQEVLGASVAEDEPLMAAGLDSLGSVELRNTLESRLGLRLPPTLVSPVVLVGTGDSMLALGFLRYETT
jgi:acyl carrier protein